jgi:hypothetical protein
MHGAGVRKLRSTIKPPLQAGLLHLGREHYRLVGQMLIEAKEQVGYDGWGNRSVRALSAAGDL